MTENQKPRSDVGGQEKEMLDFSKATLKDVPLIVETIRALRLVAKESKVQTGKTQSQILRTLTPEVLCAVALELQKHAPTLNALGGESGR